MKPYAKSHSPELVPSLSDNLEHILTLLGNSSDIVYREMSLGETERKAVAIYAKGMVDQQFLYSQVFGVISRRFLTEVEASPPDYPQNLKHFAQHASTFGDISVVYKSDQCVSEILAGNTCVLFDEYPGAVIFGTAKDKSRQQEEPASEALVRGPRIGFVEEVNENTAILRRRLKDPHLTFESLFLGRRARKEVIICYLRGVTNPDLVNEVRRRLQKIDIDDPIESGYVENYIQDNPYSPFPQVQNTERPDRVEGALLEGRVAILIDGTPFSLIVPVTFPMLMQSPEDYYDRWIPASLIRMLRTLALFFALFLPALYVALVSYHQGLIPTKLAISIAGTREGVPFPTIVEAMFMEITIELLREAGLRLPKPVGQAVGIVGGLVIGQSAVEAGIVSPIMVIVVALTAISSFAFPQYPAAIAIRLLRFGMMLAASIFGLYGIILVFVLITSHVVRLKSFGINYAAPYVPNRVYTWKDLFLRLPMQTLLKFRPAMFKPLDRNRSDQSK
ncbi:spore germination protein [Brevibacillus borstelensis]|jgi:spore germination protein|uniref:spore germination protein n=1 Tax=Brevibacillus borstelensis TaxID=45462 RepID=UPI003CEB7CF5